MLVLNGSLQLHGANGVEVRRRPNSLIRRVKAAWDGGRAKTISGKVELLMIALLAVATASLCWATIGPLGPVGNWQAPTSSPAPQSAALLSTFDAFFRLDRSRNSVITITPLDIRVHGIREDLASGRGSAIIGTPDGRQRSVMMGEEIMPGVTLKFVESDVVTISRNGKEEQVFLEHD